MTKAYMIAEKIGPSIYETHTIPYVYLKREWAEYQLQILEKEDKLYSSVKLIIREVIIVDEGPQ